MIRVEPMKMRWTTLSLDEGLVGVPDFAAMVRDYLASGGGMNLVHDPTAIGKTILRQLEARGPRPKGSKSLRLSGSGSCIKRQAYDWHGVESNGFESDASSVLAFATGDATEGLLATAMLEVFERMSRSMLLDERTANIHPELTSTGEGQDEVLLRVPFAGGLDKALLSPYPGITIPGHPDGQGVFPFWPQGGEPEARRFTLEIKSMSDYGFDKFRAHGLKASDGQGPDGYFYQSQAYQLAQRQAGVDVEWTYVIAFGKSVGAKDAQISPDFSPPLASRGPTKGKPKKTFMVSDPTMWGRKHSIVGQWMRRDESVQADIIERYQRVMTSGSADEFGFPYEPDEKGRLKFPCDWCPHLLNCYPNAAEQASKGGWFKPNTKIFTFT